MKRMGRPADDPKIHQVKFRMTEDEVYRLSVCANMLGLTKTDIVNEGVQSIYDKLMKQIREEAKMLNLNDKTTVNDIAKEYGMSDREIELQHKENGMFVMTVDEFIEQEQSFCKGNDFTEEDVQEHIEYYGAESWSELREKLSSGSGSFAKGLHKLEYKNQRLILVTPL